MTNTDDLLKQGIAALKAGQKAQGRRLLEQVVQQDKNNETAWLWLSGAVDTDRERIHCLRETLRINPNNQHARRGLEQLESKVSTLRPAQPVEKKPIRPLGIQPPPAREEKKHDAEPIQVALRAHVEGTKQCPYCAETVKAEAIVCRFCGQDLNSAVVPSSTTTRVTRVGGGGAMSSAEKLGLILLALGLWYAGFAAPTVRACEYGLFTAMVGAFLFLVPKLTKGGH